MKYTFPLIYLGPINDAFSGLFNRARIFFKIGKKETDLKKEAMMMDDGADNRVNSQGIPLNNINNQEINPINNNLGNNVNNPGLENAQNDYNNQHNSMNYPKNIKLDERERLD